MMAMTLQAYGVGILSGLLLAAAIAVTYVEFGRGRRR